MHRAPWLFVGIALCSCSGVIEQSGGDDGGGLLGGGIDAATFHCDLPGETPTLEPVRWLHPTQPKAGETLTLSLQSQNTAGNNGPQLDAEITDREGTRTIDDLIAVGGAKAIYHFAFGDLAVGENCIVVRKDGNVEAAFKVVVAAAEPAARGNGPWKIVRNHQWRCDEQPDFGNLLTVKVVDEAGAPLSGVTVDLRWPEDTVYPVAPDDTAQSFEEHGQPKTMTTNEQGIAELLTPWGTGIRSPIDAKPGYMVFNVAIAGGASDRATEISTGIWETNWEGCNYCNKALVNVYGHWSYTVEFQRQPQASEVCEVGVDHAGQESCSYQHFYHDPERPSCRAIAP